MDTLAYHIKGLDLEEKFLNIVGSGVGLSSTPTKDRGRGGMQWEAEANVWLTEQIVNLNLGGKSELISKLIRINNQIVGKFGFGDEIRAHQELEGYLMEEDIKTHYILDYFEPRLTTRTPNPTLYSCLVPEECCARTEAGRITPQNI